MSNFYTNELSTANNTGCLTANNTSCLSDPEVIIPEEEDKNAFECDDCNSKGIDCYEQLGLTKEESLIYMDLGEPDRCEDCFDKWKNTSDAADYLKQTEEEDEEEEIGEEQFRCPSCKLVQSMSTCYLCEIENTCETCVGDGGSYGEDEEWICQPCVDKQPEEEVEEYPFYIYHDASFGDDRDNCPACYGSYGDLSEEAIETIHDEYDDTDDIPCYSRQRLNAYLKPSTYKRLTAKTLNTNTVLFALANMGLWGECDEELGLDKLDDDEIVEDASDDLYVCYANGGKEYDAHSYFREHKIHLCFGGSGCTEFAEWHDDGVHPQN